MWGEGADTIGSPGPGHRERDCSGTAGTFPPALASFLRPAPAPHPRGSAVAKGAGAGAGAAERLGLVPTARGGGGVSARGRHRDGKTSGLGVRDRGGRAPNQGF